MFRRPSPEQHGHVDAPALELALVPQRRALHGCDGDGRRATLRRRELTRRPRLVVILGEADQVLLIVAVGTEVAADLFRIGMDEPVVEPLVVAVVEAELLELPLEIP